MNDIAINHKFSPSHTFEGGYVHSIDRKKKKGSQLITLINSEGNVLKSSYEFPSFLKMGEGDRVAMDFPRKWEGDTVPVVRAQVYRKNAQGVEEMAYDYLGHRDSAESYKKR